MSVTVHTSEEVARLSLAGEIDFSFQEELNQAAAQVLDAGAARIEIDMQQTNFIDSAVIRMFLKMHESAKRKQVPLHIVNCNAHIREIFQIGGFDQIFHIE
jgi:anti-sigma B factor antagonist